MAQYYNRRHGAIHHRRNLFPLIIILLVYISLTLLGHSIDSIVHIRTEKLGEYSDTIRHRSGHSSVTVFARSSDAAMSAFHGFGSLGKEDREEGNCTF